MKIGTKILTVTTGALFVSLIVSLVVFLPRFQAQLMDQRVHGAKDLNAMLQITLENAMLRRDLEGLGEIVLRLGSRPNISQIMILNTAGEVRFASQATTLGVKLNPVELCPGCDWAGGRLNADYITSQNGEDVVRAVNVVANREPCQVCHGAIGFTPINGYLAIDYKTGDVGRRAFELTLSQGLGGLLLIAIALALVGLAIRYLVAQPIQQLEDISGALRLGRLETHAVCDALGQRKDEIGSLARRFSEMAKRIALSVSELAESKAFLQAVIDSHPDGLRVIDADYRVIAANRAFAEQCGPLENDVLALPCYGSSYHRSTPCPPTLVICPIHALSKAGERMKTVEIHEKGPGAQTIALERHAVKTEIATRDGVKIYIVEAFRTLDHHLAVSQEQRLSEIGQLASGVAHEIHNPLSSIRLGIRAIRELLPKGEAFDAKLTEYFAVVDHEINRCVAVTDRLMRLSRAPSEQGVLINVADAVADLVALSHYEAELQNVVMIAQIPDDLRVVSGEGELPMILLNLIQNAFHAMPEGGLLTISARATSEGDIEIAVTDTGVGIEPEKLPFIFQPFWSQRHDGTTGSGLGLAIARALMKKRNGDVFVETRKGMGATFRLRYTNPDVAIAGEDPEVLALI